MVDPMPPNEEQANPISTGTEIGWSHCAQISVPSPENERRLAIRAVDWTRIKRSVKQIHRPLKSLQFWYSCLAGAAVTAGFTIIPLACTQGVPSWVMPFYIIATGACGLMAWILYRVDQKIVETQGADAEGVYADMQEIEQHFEIVVSQPAEKKTA